MMYKINPLQRNVLITNDEVIFHAPTEHTLDPRTIQNSIIIAEERFIRPALCNDFYTEIATQKNVVITDANRSSFQSLVNNSTPAGSTPVTLVNGMIVNAMERLNDANQKLWKEYLWKLTAECVLLVAMPEAYIHFTSEGAVHKAPSSNSIQAASVFSPELRAMKWARDTKLMDRIDPLLQAMHEWICNEKKANSGLYANYCKVCDCDINGNAYKKKNDMLLNLYDDEENSCVCY